MCEYVWLSFFFPLSLPLILLRSSCRGLLLHLITPIGTHAVVRTPLGEGSARRRDLNLSTNNSHKRQISMSLAGFEPSFPASERTQAPAVDRPATGIGCVCHGDKAWNVRCLERTADFHIDIISYVCL
jgi:hypothetical protein